MPRLLEMHDPEVQEHLQEYSSVTLRFGNYQYHSSCFVDGIPCDPSRGSTKKILLGTNSGDIYEYSLNKM
jgi:hypothetical protein